MVLRIILNWKLKSLDKQAQSSWSYDCYLDLKSNGKKRVG